MKLVAMGSIVPKASLSGRQGCGAKMQDVNNGLSRLRRELHRAIATMEPSQEF